MTCLVSAEKRIVASPPHGASRRLSLRDDSTTTSTFVAFRPQNLRYFRGAKGDFVSERFHGVLYSHVFFPKINDTSPACGHPHAPAVQRYFS